MPRTMNLIVRSQTGGSAMPRRCGPPCTNRSDRGDLGPVSDADRHRSHHRPAAPTRLDLHRLCSARAGRGRSRVYAVTSFVVGTRTRSLGCGWHSVPGPTTCSGWSSPAACRDPGGVVLGAGATLGTAGLLRNLLLTSSRSTDCADRRCPGHCRSRPSRHRSARASRRASRPVDRFARLEVFMTLILTLLVLVAALVFPIRAGILDWPAARLVRSTHPAARWRSD